MLKFDLKLLSSDVFQVLSGKAFDIDYDDKSLSISEKVDRRMHVACILSNKSAKFIKLLSGDKKYIPALKDRKELDLVHYTSDDTQSLLRNLPAETSFVKCFPESKKDCLLVLGLLPGDVNYPWIAKGFVKVKRGDKWEERATDEELRSFLGNLDGLTSEDLSTFCVSNGLPEGKIVKPMLLDTGVLFFFEDMLKVRQVCNAFSKWNIVKVSNLLQNLFVECQHGDIFSKGGPGSEVVYVLVSATDSVWLLAYYRAKDAYFVGSALVGGRNIVAVISDITKRCMTQLQVGPSAKCGWVLLDLDGKQALNHTIRPKIAENVAKVEGTMLEDVTSLPCTELQDASQNQNWKKELELCLLYA